MQTVPTTREATPRNVPAFARVPVLVIAALTALAHLGFAIAGRGYWLDEVLMLAVGRHHLDWGSADQPPVVPLLAAAADAIAPGSMVALRVPAILATAAAVVVASHGRDETPVLTAALRAGVPYVALVASRSRAASVLAALDVTDDERARVHAPAGMTWGVRGAPEIALSIFAEFAATRAACTAPVPAEVVDPVCGMTVTASPHSPSATHDSRTVHFCGPGCRDTFLDDPARYAG